MKKTSKHHDIEKLTTFGIALILLCGIPVNSALAAEETVEEIIVIGSYIRRDNFNMAAPVSIIDATDFEQSGALQLGELVADATYNYGSSDVRNSLNGGVDYATNFNLRGLGQNATLNLLDGRRVVFGNVNSAYPSIALQRFEVLRDGGSALYGSNAVAGVVNMIPIKEYDGLKIQVGYDGDERGTSHKSSFEGVGGFSFGATDIVLAWEYEDRPDAIRWPDRPQYLRAGFSDSGSANPGNFFVGTRDENGLLDGGFSRRPDPGCGTDGSSTDEGALFSNTSGFIGAFGDCRLAYGTAHDAQTAIENLNLYSNITHEFSPSLTFELQGIYNLRKANLHNSPASPGGDLSRLPFILGDNPFNPFRAMDALGNPLFAQDLNGDGVPDRDGAGIVILDPNGIPFNEDVAFANWRPFGKGGTQPEGNTADGASTTIRKEENMFVSARAIYEIPGTSWDATLTTSYQKQRDSSGGNADWTNRIVDGLSGVGGPNGDEYFNPFYTDDPAKQNSQSVVDYIRERSTGTDTKITIAAYDFVTTGDLFEFAGRTVAAAFGGQYLDVYYSTDPHQIVQQNERWGGRVAEPPYRLKLDMVAVFAELSVPLLDNLELQLAVRNEDWGGGLDTTDPKVGLLYQPMDALSLRASWATSFIAPNPFQLAGPEFCGNSNVQDTVLGASPTFVSTCRGPNPFLISETAESWNIGFTWLIIDDLTLLMDYIDIDFEDRFVFTSAQDIVDLDRLNMDKSGLTGEEWIRSGSSDPRVTRNPVDLSIQTIRTGESNASKMTFSSVDASLIYNFDAGGWGDFTTRLDASYINDYSYQLLPFSPEVQGTGKQNNPTGAVPPLPRWKSNLSLNWRRGDHAATIRVTYTHDVRYDSILGGFAGLVDKAQFVPENIKSWTQVNAQYRIDLTDMLTMLPQSGETRLTLGINNLLDEMAQLLFLNGGYENRLHSPIGRVFYARFSYQF